MKTPPEKPVNPVGGSPAEECQDGHAIPGIQRDDLLFIPVGCTARPSPRPPRNPCDVQHAQDLPQRLFVASLVPELFSTADTGWRARYEDRVPGTAVELEYTSADQTLRGRFVWNGLESLSVFANGKNWKTFAHQMALPPPDDWIRLLYAQLKLTSNVRCIFGSEDSPTISSFPDGAMMTLMFPVPVNRLHVLPECLDQIDADANIEAPVVMTAALSRATVETRPAVQTDADDQDRPTTSSIGSKLAAAGDWVYLAHVTCFFRDLTRVIFRCQRAGLIGANDPKAGVKSYPDGAVWAASVHPVVGHAHGYSFVTTGGEPSLQVRYREVHPVNSASRVRAANDASRAEVEEKLKAAEILFGQQPGTFCAVTENETGDKENTMSDVDENEWALVGSGELGGAIHWEEEFSPIANVKYNLWLLEEIGEAVIDMDDLLKGLNHLQVLGKLSFPPLYSERDFDSIDGFITFEDDEFEGAPGTSFNSIRIYVDRDTQATLLQEFRLLNERIESLGTERGLI